ncbi:hypothetical protein ACHAXA_003389 [Cyclostephanos tholiformis]|uniref:EGF-like domain-containing protein n=1 Tax=Cyclostephanos tholiformis TaxID=382380 RepID=A0ABD3RCX4_9STRA
MASTLLPMPSPDYRNPSFPRALVVDADCGGCNDGKCIEPKADASSSSTTTPLGPTCDCAYTGYIGEHCDLPCSKECENGGKCVPAPEGEEGGSETCSCTKAVVDGNPYAGLRCEYGATKSCMTLGSISKHSFCTNGGDCADIVLDNEMHVDCICPEGYEGPHCEYLAGEAPNGGMGSGSTSSSSSSTATTVAGAALASTGESASERRLDATVFVLIIAFAAFIGMLLLAFFVRARRRRTEAKRRERQAREETEEFSMIPTNDPETEII